VRLQRYVQIKPRVERTSVCQACVCTGAEGFPIGEIGLSVVPSKFANACKFGNARRTSFVLLNVLYPQVQTASLSSRPLPRLS
jgi:hypothetical protein